MRPPDLCSEFSYGRVGWIKQKTWTDYLIFYQKRVFTKTFWWKIHDSKLWVKNFLHVDWFLATHMKKFFKFFLSLTKYRTIQIQPTFKIPCIDLTVQNAVLAIKWQLFRLSKNRLLFPEKVVSHIKANLDGCSSLSLQALNQECLKKRRPDHNNVEMVQVLQP